MRYPTTKRSDHDVREFIDAWFAKRKTMQESISYLVSVIRDEGISFPTRHSAAMDEFERLGYTLISDRNKYGSLVRTYVQAGRA